MWTLWSGAVKGSKTRAADNPEVHPPPAASTTTSMTVGPRHLPPHVFSRCSGTGSFRRLLQAGRDRLGRGELVVERWKFPRAARVCDPSTIPNKSIGDPAGARRGGRGDSGRRNSAPPRLRSPAVHIGPTRPNKKEQFLSWMMGGDRPMWPMQRAATSTSRPPPGDTHGRAGQ